MKKSPLSRMNKNQGNSGYQYSPYGNHQNPNWMNHDNYRGGNNYQASNNYNYRNSQANSGSDYIPFQASSPVSRSGTLQGSGGMYSGYHQNRRNSYNNSPGSNHSSPHSRYGYSPKQNRGRKNFQKGSQKIVDITAYLDINSIFENPWADLEEQLNNVKSKNESKLFEDDSLEDIKRESSSLSPNSISGSLTDKTLDISDLSQDIKPSPEHL